MVQSFLLLLILQCCWLLGTATASKMYAFFCCRGIAFSQRPLTNWKSVVRGGRRASRISAAMKSLHSSNSQKPPVLISSTKSNTVKKWQNLLTKRKKRLEENATVIEGPRMVFDLLENPKTSSLIKQVMISEQKADTYQGRLQNHDANLRVVLGTDEVLVACSDTVTPQGIVATIAIPPEPSQTEPPVNDEGKKQPLYLVLDGVSDPGNVGTLLRSSVAVGVAAVVVLPQCCDVWNPKAVRSAMGCSFQVPILSVDSWDEGLHVLKTWGVQNVFAATMAYDNNDGDQGTKPSVEHYNVDWMAAPTALVIGSEGTGLTSNVREAVSSGTVGAVHVPMEAGIESLNAAVCGSVILFEYLRQCKMTIPEPKP